MERVFASGRIDPSLNGDWEDVQVELGLLPKRLTPAPNCHSRFFPVASVDSRPEPSFSAHKQRRAADKKRRKWRGKRSVEPAEEEVTLNDNAPPACRRGVVGDRLCHPEPSATL